MTKQARNTRDAIIRGVAGVIDLGGQFDRREISTASDAENLRNDWRAVGNDLRTAMKRASDRGTR